MELGYQFDNSYSFCCLHSMSDNPPGLPGLSTKCQCGHLVKAVYFNFEKEPYDPCRKVPIENIIRAHVVAFREVQFLKEEAQEIVKNMGLNTSVMKNEFGIILFVQNPLNWFEPGTVRMNYSKSGIMKACGTIRQGLRHRQPTNKELQDSFHMFMKSPFSLRS